MLDPKATWAAKLFDSVDLALESYGEEQLKNRDAIFLSGILHVETDTWSNVRAMVHVLLVQPGHRQ